MAKSDLIRFAVIVFRFMAGQNSKINRKLAGQPVSYFLFDFQVLEWSGERAGASELPPLLNRGGTLNCCK